jgi:hypothetical protein
MTPIKFFEVFWDGMLKEAAGNESRTDRPIVAPRFRKN